MATVLDAAEACGRLRGSQIHPDGVRRNAFVPSYLIASTSREEVGSMWWAIGIGGVILYLIVAFTLGLMTLRNGHGWMFFFGIFFPILWIFGAFMRPPDTAASAY